jgi:hypothetical protein
LAEIFFCCGKLYCTDPYSLYRFGTKIEVIFGTDFEADFSFLFTVFGPYGIVHTVDCGNMKMRQKRSDNGTVLAWKTRQIFVGQFLCCEVFSLAGNVILLLFVLS